MKRKWYVTADKEGYVYFGTKKPNNNIGYKIVESCVDTDTSTLVKLDIKEEDNSDSGENELYYEYFVSFAYIPVGVSAYVYGNMQVFYKHNITNYKHVEELGEVVRHNIGYAIHGLPVVINFILLGKSEP